MQPPAQDKYKLWGIALLIFLLILIPSEIGLIKNLSSKKGNSFNSTTKIKALAPTPHLLDFEFDPNSNQVSKVDLAKVDGDPDVLDSSPSLSDRTFAFKIEVISPKNGIVASGWASQYKTVISTEEGKYDLRITILYETGSTIKIISTDKKTLWEGII